MKSRILVLASSTKHDGRCVAGRQWLGGTADQPRLGDWIRPQGEETHGAILHPKFRLYRDVGGSRIARYGRPVEPGDLVEPPAGTVRCFVVRVELGNQPSGRGLFRANAGL